MSAQDGAAAGGFTEWMAEKYPDGQHFSRIDMCAAFMAGAFAAAMADDGRHPDGRTCQFCREDEREERERADRQDADDDGPTSQFHEGDWDDAVSEATS